MQKKMLLMAVAGLLVLASAVSLVGCGPKAADPAATDATQSQAADPAAQDPAAQQQAQQPASTVGNIKPVADVTELKIEDVKKGSGAAVKENDTITVHYTLWLGATGQKIESSKDSGQPVTFPLVKGQLIDGWVQGIPGMKVGGVRKLIVPGSLGYGAQGNQGIPPNATLVFEVELVSIGK